MLNIKEFEYLGNTVKFHINELATESFLNLLYHEFEVEDSYGIKKVNFNDGDILIDCGANMGFFSIPLAKKYPNIRIYAFEADPSNYKILLENIKLNNMENHKNLIVYNKAVTNTGLPIFVSPSDNIGENAISENKNGNVQSVRLDDFMKQENIEKIKFLKMDIEGAEYDILMNFAHLKNVEYFGGEFHYGYFKNNKLLKHLYKNIDQNNCSIDGLDDKVAWYIYIALLSIARFCNRYPMLRPVAKITLIIKSFLRNIYFALFSNKPNL